MHMTTAPNQDLCAALDNLLGPDNAYPTPEERAAFREAQERLRDASTKARIERRKARAQAIAKSVMEGGQA